MVWLQVNPTWGRCSPSPARTSSRFLSLRSCATFRSWRRRTLLCARCSTSIPTPLKTRCSASTTTRRLEVSSSVWQYDQDKRIFILIHFPLYRQIVTRCNAVHFKISTGPLLDMLRKKFIQLDSWYWKKRKLKECFLTQRILPKIIFYNQKKWNQKFSFSLSTLILSSIPFVKSKKYTVVSFSEWPTIFIYKHL